MCSWTEVAYHHQSGVTPIIQTPIANNNGGGEGCGGGDGVVVTVMVLWSSSYSRTPLAEQTNPWT